MSHERFELGQLEKTAAEGGFLRATNFDARPFFNGLHVCAGFMQAAARAGVQPRKATRQPLHAQFSPPQIRDIQIRDLQLAARRRLLRLGQRHHFVVKNVEAGDGVIALGQFGFLLNRNRLAVRVELHHPVALRVVDVITENGRPAIELRKRLAENIAAIKDIIAENQRHVVVTNKRFRNQKRLRDAGGFGLLAIINAQPKTTTIAEQLFKARQVMGCGNKTEFPDATFNQSRERIINHRLVINRLELFARDERQRIESRSRPTCQYDAFHFIHV